MFSRIHSAVCKGIEGADVYVETDIARGLPSINIVGLASTMVVESKERIRSAIVNSGLEFPRGRITVNLTPASLRKNGSCLDLPIAVGILVSFMEAEQSDPAEVGVIGELSLEGSVLGVDGVLPMLLRLKDSGVKRAVIPYQNAQEAALVSGIEVIPVRSISECIRVLEGGTVIGEQDMADAIQIDNSNANGMPHLNPENDEKLYLDRSNNGIPDGSEVKDYADIRGQEKAKRALTIAAAGRHGLLMIGSPGCGKTMLASRLPSIMPPMTDEERIETAVIYSASGRLRPGEPVPTERPFRDPHCTIGRAGLIGGGNIPVPGEITLAHNGVLFMDEVCEYESRVIEGLRTPIEEKRIVHFRKGESYIFPCDFQLLMAANPCPCGFYGDPDRPCKCTESQLEKYRRKLSGPMMDRIDMSINMEKVSYDELSTGGSDQKVGGSQSGKGKKPVSTEEMRRDVERGISYARLHGRAVFNSRMSDRDIDKYCVLEDEEERFMQRAYDALKMSPRALRKVLKVARTIADIDESLEIRQTHLAEALSYRLTGEN